MKDSQMCKSEKETLEHVFYKIRYVRSLWSDLTGWLCKILVLQTIKM